LPGGVSRLSPASIVSCWFNHSVFLEG
jgi:hypothetical protein